jgi:selenocysteine lyase/cysteine desulfurase
MDARRTGGTGGLSRRTFARLVALGGSGLLAAGRVTAEPPTSIQNPGEAGAGSESYWESIREQFVLPADLAVMSAANLCPSPRVVLQTLEKYTAMVDSDPSQENRRKTAEGREAARRALAGFLRASPEDILITRNTSEGNNLVSSGLDLRAGDEVVISADNHPSAHAAFRDKAKRFGFTVKVVEQISPHPGAEYYLEAFARAMTPQTRLLAFTHVTASAGDRYPAKALCRLARERGVLTLVDGAQSFGVLDIDLADMQPDFFTGSAHKWPCGPKEAGVLYVSKGARAGLWPPIVSLYAGSVGVSRTHEGLGQRDEPKIMAFAEALAFQSRIGRGAIEARACALAERLIDGLQTIDGVRVWTHRDPARSAAIVTFQPGRLDPGKLGAALYQNDRITSNTRSGPDRPGIRLSPHVYTLPGEIDRALAAIRRYMKSGL